MMRTIPFSRRAAVGVALGLSVLLSTGAAIAVDPDRGALLYENHCRECHTSQVHFRERRKAKSLDELWIWVARWQADLDLDWTAEEVDDVARHLNTTYYGFSATQ